MTLSKSCKNLFTREKLSELNEMGKRFLKKCSINKDKWVIMEDKEARTKLSQAFCDSVNTQN